MKCIWRESGEFLKFWKSEKDRIADCLCGDIADYNFTILFLYKQNFITRFQPEQTTDYTRFYNRCFHLQNRHIHLQNMSIPERIHLLKWQYK